MMKRVLILSGPTREHIDPVRFIGNASSGKMGKALAEEALTRGLDVDFITGPVADANLPGTDAMGTAHLQRFKITSAEEMLAAAQKKFSSADAIIFAAAVADFRPADRSDEKLPKSEQALSIRLEPTPDIAATLCADRRPHQIAVGFALQTHEGEARAREKLISKNLSGIVLNTPAALGAETGLFTWIDKQARAEWGTLDKTDCAKRIFDRIS
jgi:phosphopantothenoylcysteine decarboxylase/phosphopantothenate--cysteine ligase